MSTAVPDKAITTAQAAEQLGLLQGTVSDLVKHGFIAGYRVKLKRFLIDPASVAAFAALLKTPLVEALDYVPPASTVTLVDGPADQVGTSEPVAEEVIHP